MRRWSEEASPQSMVFTPPSVPPFIGGQKPSERGGEGVRDDVRGKKPLPQPLSEREGRWEDVRCMM